MTENDRNERDLDEFWNDLVRHPGADRTAHSAESSLIIALDRLSNEKQAEASRKRVANALNREIETLKPPSIKNGHARQPTTANRRELQKYGSRSTTGPRAHSHSLLSRAISYAAVALLMLTTGLGIGKIAFRVPADRPSLSSSHAKPSGLDDWTTLLDVTLPAGMVSGEKVESSLSYSVVSPGAQAVWLPAPGIQLRHVLTGQLTVWSSDALHILRVDSPGQWELLEAGEEADLGAGDSMVLMETSRVHFDNHGIDPAELLSLILSEDYVTARLNPAGWHVEDQNSKSIAFDEAPGTGTRIQFRTFFLLRGATVLLFGANMPQLLVNSTSTDLGTPVSASAAMLVGNSISISPNFDTTVFVAYVTAG